MKDISSLFPTLLPLAKRIVVILAAVIPFTIIAFYLFYLLSVPFVGSTTAMADAVIALILIFLAADGIFLVKKGNREHSIFLGVVGWMATIIGTLLFALHLSIYYW
jgi:hypothetical protein